MELNRLAAKSLDQRIEKIVELIYKIRDPHTMNNSETNVLNPMSDTQTNDTDETDTADTDTDVI